MGDGQILDPERWVAALERLLAVAPWAPWATGVVVAVLLIGWFIGRVKGK